MDKPISSEPIFTDFCSECNYVTSSNGNVYKKRREWFCVGLIKRPKNPKDAHEKNNRIQMCLQIEGSRKIACFTFTEMEIASIISMESEALAYSLTRLQSRMRGEIE